MKSPLISFLISVLALSMASFVLFRNQNNGIEVVDIRYLFENFEYKKQLQKEFESVIQYRKYEVDSLQLVYDQNINNGASAEAVEKSRLFLLNKSKEYQESNYAMTNEFDRKIYKQLKQYLREYVKLKNISLIVGEMDDNLSVVGDGEVDKSKEILEYVNKAYLNQK